MKDVPYNLQQNTILLLQHNKYTKKLFLLKVESVCFTTWGKKNTIECNQAMKEEMLVGRTSQVEHIKWHYWAAPKVLQGYLLLQL